MINNPKLHNACDTNNAMHSDDITDGGTSMQKRHNPPVHGSERPQNRTEAADAGLPVHSLYVGSRDGRAFPDADRQTVIDTAAASFGCFTVVDADGCFKGRSVATLVIKIATDDEALVEALGHNLGRLIDQQAVGLETAGYYKSISMG